MGRKTLKNFDTYTDRPQGRSAVQKDQLGFGTPFVKKGSRGAFGHRHRCSNTTRWRSNDVELGGPDKTSGHSVREGTVHTR